MQTLSVFSFDYHSFLLKTVSMKIDLNYKTNSLPPLIPPFSVGYQGMLFTF